MGSPQLNKRKSIQTWLRAACLIVRKLAAPAKGSRPSEGSELDALTARVNAAKHRVEICITKGWKVALVQAVVDYQRQIRRLQDYLEAELTKPTCDAFRLDEVTVLQDLLAAQNEFSRVNFNGKEKLLSVTTSEIVLDGEELGEFSIVLHLNTLGDSNRFYYEVHPVNPNWAGSEDGVAHPHVHHDRLCEGDGQPAIKLALEQGRLLDFFQIVEQVLGNYNPSSAYVEISAWHGSASEDCGHCGHATASSDLCECASCEANVCNECTYGCHACSDSFCGNCNETCAGCHENFCTHCIRSCNQCGESMCSDCLNNERCDDCEEKENEEEGPDDSQTPVHADGVGQVAVPA